ncbi:hypothetical protein ACRAWD_24205 [Caulobacter segnis]
MNIAASTWACGPGRAGRGGHRPWPWACLAVLAGRRRRAAVRPGPGQPVPAPGAARTPRTA